MHVGWKAPSRARGLHPCLRTHLLKSLDSRRIAIGRARLVMVADIRRRAYQSQCANALGPPRGEDHAKQPAERFAAVVNGIDAEVIDDRLEIGKQTLRGLF